MKNFLEKNSKLIIGAIVAASFFAVFFPLNIANAGILPEGWDDTVKDVDELVQLEEGDATDMVKRLITDKVIPLFKYVFVGVAIIYFTLSLFMIITSAGNEDQIRKYRGTLAWSLLGFSLISISAEVANIFDPVKNQGQIADVEGTKTVLQKFITYMQLSLGTISIAASFYAAFRFITAHGDQEIINKAKKFFKWGFAGIVFVMLADPLINGVIYPPAAVAGEAGVGKEEATEFTKQIVALIKFLLTFLSVLLFISFIISGAFFLTSFGAEDRHNKAKQILIGSIIGGIIMFTAYALTTFFIPD